MRQADTRLPRELQKTNKQAAEFVAGRMRSRAEGLGGVAAKSAPSIKAAAEQRRVKVSFGGARYPFAMGANFGARHDISRQTSRGVMRGWNQFERPTEPDRFFYATIKATRGPFIEYYGDMLDALLARIERERRAS